MLTHRTITEVKKSVYTDKHKKFMVKLFLYGLQPPPTIYAGDMSFIKLLKYCRGVEKGQLLNIASRALGPINNIRGQPSGLAGKLGGLLPAESGLGCPRLELCLAYAGCARGLDLDQSFAGTHRWAVAQTIPHREIRAATRIRELGLPVVLPLIQHSRRVNGKRIKLELSAYPGYIFFGFIDSWIRVLGLERDTKEFKTVVQSGGYVPHVARPDTTAPETYVVRVLLNERSLSEKSPPSPALIPTWFVKELQDIMDAHGGYIPVAQAQRFTSGQKIRVNELRHAFYGVEGTYEYLAGEERARVLLDMLGRKVPTVLNERDLVAA